MNSIQRRTGRAEPRQLSRAVELERAAARERSNAERVTELDARIAAAAGELEQTKTQSAARLPKSASSRRRFWRRRRARPGRSTRRWQERQHEARTAADEVFNAERKLEADRSHAMHLLTLAGNARNSTAQAEESLAALEREAERLNAEMSQARNEQESLGVQSGQARLRFESAAETLKRLEVEIAELREQIAGAARGRRRECARGRTNCAANRPRQWDGRNSLESLIRDHSYSTETVRRLLQPRTRLAEGLDAGGHAGRLYRSERRARRRGRRVSA